MTTQKMVKFEKGNKGGESTVEDFHPFHFIPTLFPSQTDYNESVGSDWGKSRERPFHPLPFIPIVIPFLFLLLVDFLLFRFSLSKWTSSKWGLNSPKWKVCPFVPFHFNTICTPMCQKWPTFYFDFDSRKFSDFSMCNTKSKSKKRNCLKMKWMRPKLVVDLVITRKLKWSKAPHTNSEPRNKYSWPIF